MKLKVQEMGGSDMSHFCNGHILRELDTQQPSRGLELRREGNQNGFNQIKGIIILHDSLSNFCRFHLSCNLQEKSSRTNEHCQKHHVMKMRLVSRKNGKLNMTKTQQKSSFIHYLTCQTKQKKESDTNLLALICL